MTRMFLMLSMLIFFVGCAQAPQKKENLGLKYPVELQKVQELLKVNKTADARLQIEDYLNKAENIHWYGHAYFLRGFLYELDEDYENSIKGYRAAIQHGSQYESRVEAKALYNLSFVYEKLDQRKELLISLIDLMKRQQFFDRLTGQVEIPARLAAAYASQGKMKEALTFHGEAKYNYNRLIRGQRYPYEKSEISKSLYYLGFATFDENNEPFTHLAKKLTVGQKYFLESAEASNSTWSEKSVERLKALYDKAWGMVLQYQPKDFDHDPLAKKKQRHRKQLVMASELYDLMHVLRAQEFPMSDVNARSKAIVDVTGKWIDKIEKFALTLSVGPETVRTKRVKNTRLAQYVEEEKQKVEVNKEKTLPNKKDIGKDPNL